MQKPIIAVTQGDPAGIGPEIARKAMIHPGVLAVCRPLLIDFPQKASRVKLGRSSRLGGELSYEALCCAVALAKRGAVQGIATAPIDKKSWDMAGVKFPGHTEALGALCRTNRYAMMFVDRQMRMTLVTRHLALQRVPRAITRGAVKTAIELTADVLRKAFKIRRPRMVVLGLNPHGGRDNLFGEEEKRVIGPAVEACRRDRRLSLLGPVPADSAFRPSMMKRVDAYIAMYHDQGLIPFKMIAFERGVNVTIGLPFVRTSPDHGTAYDVAGTGRADAASMRESIILAARLARER